LNIGEYDVLALGQAPKAWNKKLRQWKLFVLCLDYLAKISTFELLKSVKQHTISSCSCFVNDNIGKFQTQIVCGVGGFDPLLAVLVKSRRDFLTPQPLFVAFQGT